MAQKQFWHVYCMKVYRFGEVKNYYDLIIEEDNGEIRVASVRPKSVTEHIAKITKSPTGYQRLMYGSGSSLPYKNEKGELNERYIRIV